MIRKVSAAAQQHDYSSFPGSVVVLLEPGCGLAHSLLKRRELEVGEVLAQLGVGGRLLELPIRLGLVKLYAALLCSKNLGFSETAPPCTKWVLLLYSACQRGLDAWHLHGYTVLWLP